MKKKILLINPPGSAEKLYGPIFKYISNFSPRLVSLILQRYLLIKVTTLL